MSENIEWDASRISVGSVDMSLYYTAWAANAAIVGRTVSLPDEEDPILVIGVRHFQTADGDSSLVCLEQSLPDGTVRYHYLDPELRIKIIG